MTYSLEEKCKICHFKRCTTEVGPFFFFLKRCTKKFCLIFNLIVRLESQKAWFWSAEQTMFKCFQVQAYWKSSVWKQFLSRLQVGNGRYQARCLKLKSEQRCNELKCFIVCSYGCERAREQRTGRLCYRWVAFPFTEHIESGNVGSLLEIPVKIQQLMFLITVAIDMLKIVWNILKWGKTFCQESLTYPLLIEMSQ